MIEPNISNMALIASENPLSNMEGLLFGISNNPPIKSIEDEIKLNMIWSFLNITDKKIGIAIMKMI